MCRLRLIAQSFGLILVTSLLISCGISSVFVAPTATPEPTPTPEPTATPEPPRFSSDVPRISAEELKERLDNGEVILIVDSRSKFSFESRHIAGAISVPRSKVEERLDEFPRDQDIVFY